MNQLSTLPVGYKPTKLDQLRTYCSGNNGYYTTIACTGLDYDWQTNDGITFGKHDGSGSGVTSRSSNLYSSTRTSGLVLNRLGKKSGRQSFFFGPLDAIVGGEFINTGNSAFISNAVGIAFKFSKKDARGTRSNNSTSTECRIQQVAGVYVYAGEINNSKIYSYNYGTVASGSLGFNQSGLSSDDKFCCYIANDNTGRENIKNRPLLLIGFLFDLYFNHHGTGEQNPTGSFWQARPIISHDTSHNGSTAKPSLM